MISNTNKFGAFDLVSEITKDNSSYEVMVLGRKFVVLPNVYSPKYFEDTGLFADNLPNFEGKSVLEVGSGTGAISVIIALSGAKRVLAVDINPDAVKNTKLNVSLHEVEKLVDVRQSDVFDSIKSEEKYDVIFWNTPFTFVDLKTVSNIEMSVCDPGYKATERFIKDSSRHLEANGKIYICFSCSVGRIDLIKKYCDEAKMSLKLIKEIKSPGNVNLKYEIFEAGPNE